VTIIYVEIVDMNANIVVRDCVEIVVILVMYVKIVFVQDVIINVHNVKTLLAKGV
jgi:hypothetical protein